jgi:nucleotide-binding universal stress UspA family protein
VTISEELRPSSVPTVPALPTVPAQASPITALTVPTQAGPPEAVLAERVRDAVATLRHALAEGTVHQHRRSGVPESWTALDIEVVRAWAAGLDVHAQHRFCHTCSPTVAG